MNYSKDLELAIDASQAAGRVVRKYYQELLLIEEKDEGKKGVLTKADKESERIIMEYLKETKYSMLGEETGKHKENPEYMWVIDPLDGTSNYLHGLPFFGVTMALMHKNEIQLGVVYSPISDELFYAEKGKGAFLNGRRIHTSDNKLQSNISIFVTHYYTKHSKDLFIKAIEQLTHQCWKRILGSSAIELSYVACGRAEAYMSSEEEIWNVAAGMLIAQEAGAIISNWQGKPLDYEKTETSSMLVATKETHQFFTKILKRIE